MTKSNKKAKKYSALNDKFSNWTTFILGSVAYLLNFFHRVNNSVLAPNLIETFNVSSANLGLMSSTYFYSYAFLQPAVGVLTDRWKPRITLTISVTIMTLGNFIFAYSPNFTYAYLGRFLIGVGSAGTYIPISWLISENYSPEKRGLIFALLPFIGHTGSLMATSPLANLIDHLGWRKSLSSIAYFSAFLTLLIALFLRDGSSNKAVAVESKVDNKINNKSRKDKVNWLDTLKEVLKIPVMKYAITASSISYSALLSFQGLWAIPFLMDICKIERGMASNLMSMMPLGMVLGILTLGRFFDTKYGKYLYLSAGIFAFIVYASFFFFMNTFASHSYKLLRVVFFTWGLFQGTGPYLMKVYSMVLPRKNFGAALGMANTFPFILAAVYQSFTGLLFDLFGKTGSLGRSLFSYKLYFLFLMLSLLISVLSLTKAIKILDRDYKGTL